MMIPQEAILAVYYGKPVDCAPEDYPEIRRAIQDQAGKWIDQGQDIRAVIALREIERLDRLYSPPLPPSDLIHS